MREVAVVIVLIIASCSSPPAETNQPVALERLAPQGLRGVPPADMAAAYRVDSLDRWKNPFLVVRRDGVELVSGTGSSGSHSVSIDQMREILVSLPMDAWPLGRVVAVQEIGIRSGNDDELIDNNVNALKLMLTKLEVQINWWPTA